jgi:hypothetical protein
MTSKAQKRREQKRANRKKRLTKERNMRANGARFRYTLECRMSKDHPWKPMKRFRDAKEIQKHLDETEAIRKRGDTEIIEGRVIDHNQLGRVVATVKPFLPEIGPSLEDAAKDIKAKVDQMEGIKEYTGPQGGKAAALGINQEIFTNPVGKSVPDAISE